MTMHLFDELAPFGRWTRLAKADGAFGEAMLQYLKEQNLIRQTEVLQATQILVHKGKGGELDGVLVYAYLLEDSPCAEDLELMLQGAMQAATVRVWSVSFKTNDFESRFGHLAGKLTASK
jgi:hypothetical protein